MSFSRGQWCVQLNSLRCALVAGLFFFFTCSSSVLQAQVTTAIIPDAILPWGNNSIVTPSGSRVDIGGGYEFILC
jgi:hypothetical protein